jgi:hypothetical protein
VGVRAGAIGWGQDSFVQVGLALAWIRDGRLYKSNSAALRRTGGSNGSPAAATLTN